MTAKGLLDFEDAAQAREELVMLIAQCECRAVVIDVRRAVPVLEQAGWDAFKARGIEVQIPATLPVAFVVPRDWLRIAHEYSVDMAQAKRLRMFFSEFADAWAWAAMRREHWRWEPSCPPSSCPARADAPGSVPQPEQCLLCLQARAQVPLADVM